MSFPQNGCNAWYLNALTYYQSGEWTININFVSNGTQYTGFKFYYNDEPEIWYINSNGSTKIYDDGVWANQAYRTIIFETRPAGDFLTWLQYNNATELSYSAEAWCYNPTLTGTALDTSYYADFISNNVQYERTRVDYGTIDYSGTDVATAHVYGSSSWYGQSYRTVILNSTATGNLLTWLTANATKVAVGQQTVTHTVSFNMKGHGTQVASQTVEDGQTATVPTPAPTESGYTFWGWYEESACTNQFDFSTPITADKTLYAKWTVFVQTYTLTFDMKGHGTQVQPQTVESGQTATEPTAPTATGYTFGGWYNETECTTAFSFSTPITANKTIYAKWTAVPQYTVSFNMNGHGSQIPSQTVYSGQTATQPSNPEADGYIFKGWFSDAGCTTVFSFSTPITANTTVYAGWKVIPVVDLFGNRYDEKYTYKRVALSNWQEHEDYDFVTGGSVEYASDADLKVTGKLDIDGFILPNTDDLIRVYYSFTDRQGLKASYPLATLIMSYASLTYTDTLQGIKATGSVDGSSVLKMLDDKKIGTPMSFASGTNPIYEAQLLIQSVGLNVKASESSIALLTSLTFDSGTSYLEIVNELCSTADFADAYPDAYGTIMLNPKADNRVGLATFTFRNNENSIIYPEIEQENDWQSAPNTIRLLYDSDSDCVAAWAVNLRGSRSSLEARGREITEFESVSDINEGDIVSNLVAKAKEMLIEKSADVEYVTIEHAYVPVGIYDTVDIEYSDMKWTGTVDNMSVELSPSTKTQTKIKRTIYQTIEIETGSTTYREAE